MVTKQRHPTWQTLLRQCLQKAGTQSTTILQMMLCPTMLLMKKYQHQNRGVLQILL